MRFLDALISLLPLLFMPILFPGFLAFTAFSGFMGIPLDICYTLLNWALPVSLIGLAGFCICMASY